MELPLLLHMTNRMQCDVQGSRVVGCVRGSAPHTSHERANSASARGSQAMLTRPKIVDRYPEDVNTVQRDCILSNGNQYIWRTYSYYIPYPDQAWYSVLQIHS